MPRYSAGKITRTAAKQRITHYVLDGEAALDHYLAGPANAMRQHSIDRFGDQIEAQRRILQPSDVAAAKAPPQTCLNCEATLTGQYCGNCGQRASSRLISIWELVRDAFGDMFELDSRVWRHADPAHAKAWPTDPRLLARPACAIHAAVSNLSCVEHSVFLDCFFRSAGRAGHSFLCLNPMWRKTARQNAAPQRNFVTALSMERQAKGQMSQMMPPMQAMLTTTSI